ncbi:MAG: hypothetical protein JKX71_07995 [Amylibacter sp.]|nr:hypothetical protein [Amylibacter sp.]
MSGLSVKGSHCSYAVYRDDERVSAFYHFQDRAFGRLDQIAKNDRSKDRNCMSCQTAFRSDGIHNRLCNHCRAKYFDPRMA